MGTLGAIIPIGMATKRHLHTLHEYHKVVTTTSQEGIHLADHDCTIIGSESRRYADGQEYLAVAGHRGLHPTDTSYTLTKTQMNDPSVDPFHTPKSAGEALYRQRCINRVESIEEKEAMRSALSTGPYLLYGPGNGIASSALLLIPSSPPPPPPSSPSPLLR
ncbi:MAG TPA: hypothetical protein V6D20_24785, partial [Candidatus Obscuribacterales bacterium]